MNDFTSNQGIVPNNFPEPAIDFTEPDVLIGQLIGTVINHKEDPAPIVGAGATSHLHIAKFECETTNNLDISEEIKRTVVP